MKRKHKRPKKQVNKIVTEDTPVPESIAPPPTDFAVTPPESWWSWWKRMMGW